MPQMNKGGKFIFGKSLIRDDGSVLLPPMAVREYDITAEGRVYLFTGSKSTGGFCVTRKGLLEPSKLGHILTDNPALRDYETVEGAFTPYKGRAYCWCPITPEGRLVLLPEMLSFLQLSPGMKLLSIRSSDIAFTMGAKGPLLKKEEEYSGKIHVSTQCSAFTPDIHCFETFARLSCGKGGAVHLNLAAISPFSSVD